MKISWLNNLIKRKKPTPIPDKEMEKTLTQKKRKIKVSYTTTTENIPTERYPASDDYNINTIEKLNSLIDENGVIHKDIVIRETEIISLKGVNKILGSLGIDSETFKSFEDLTYIKGDLWLSNNSTSIDSLDNIQKIKGNLGLRYSSIKNLGSLKEVGGDLKMRDVSVDNFNTLEVIGGDFFLSKRYKDIDFNSIEIKGKTRFWTDEVELKDRKKEQVKKVHRTTVDLGHWKIRLSLPFKFSFIHAQELEHKARVLNGNILVNNFNMFSAMNDFVVRNIEDYYSFLDKKLAELYGSKYSFYEAIFGSLKTVDQINQEIFPYKHAQEGNYPKYTNYFFSIAKKHLNDNKEEHPFNIYENVRRGLISNRKSLGWDDDKFKLWFDNVSGDNLKKKPFIYYMENLIYEYFYSFILASQDEFRVSKGMPKIGEGWVSETELYYLLKDEFESEEVINHGKPDWLGRQHVDIWFPKHKIGIEYQGLQHDEPIEFFGGKEAHEKNIERDERKRVLFEENKAMLIEVREGYDFDIIVQKIKNVIV